MSRTDNIYSDKLSLELFREGKRPVENGEAIDGLLFINNKATGSTKLAIRPKSGTFVLGEQTNQNPSASIDDRTNYLLFCDGVHVDPVIDCDNAASTTNRAVLNGNFMLEKFGVLDTTERNTNSLLREIEKDPNLVVLYDHDEFDGYKKQVIICPEVIMGATDSFYIELDGVHINSKGEHLIDALLNYGEGKRLLVEPYNQYTVASILAQNSMMVENRDDKPHTLYIRYIGTNDHIMDSSHETNPAIFTNMDKGYQADPDGLGVMITFAANDQAFLTVLPWFQYTVGGDAIVGNRYVIDVNGTQYRDSRPIDDISYPTASLEGVVATNPDLARLISVTSGGEYNEFKNLTNSYLDIKIYLDEFAPYYQANKTVDAGDNPTGIYKKLKYPYGATVTTGYMRKVYTTFPSVYIGVSNDGYSFRLGPSKDENR